MHGVAIELTHGTWISWHGKLLKHCSAVPRVAEGDALLSLFASLPADACNVFAREQACGNEIAKRMSRGVKGSGAEGLYSELRLGLKVMLRWVPPCPVNKSKKGKRKWGAAKFRWVKCRVVGMDEERGTADLREMHTWYVHADLHAGDLWNRMVIGHY